MEIRRLPADEKPVRRYLEELWLPYNRELGELLDDFSLADDVDIVSEELEYRLERHETDGYRVWVAVDGSNGAESSGDFVGFVATEVDEAPAVFDRPDRLVVCDIYVTEPYRGTGLAGELIERAERQAREAGCDELKLKVDVENERALAFYDKLGFEHSRHTMVAPVAEE
ncbi:GNAT family N-acetyltransferase [Natronobacterium texcoconense]|uniref:Acetyltransferase (GNAT) family protein n=1 Tax=Natronobacterium texcoconense TaxID=1095778 RepID=A0A1H1GW93_NATTX|nr:GNAT family N-acetyltransferase [Natronobacterium texcoconense]SDR17106.1 Acetyltransferase (GNAT) family protein [Natronobacterium texcoconense]